MWTYSKNHKVPNIFAKCVEINLEKWKTARSSFFGRAPSAPCPLSSTRRKHDQREKRLVQPFRWQIALDSSSCVPKVVWTHCEDAFDRYRWWCTDSTEPLSRNVVSMPACNLLVFFFFLVSRLLKITGTTFTLLRSFTHSPLRQQSSSVFALNTLLELAYAACANGRGRKRLSTFRSISHGFLYECACVLRLQRLPNKALSHPYIGQVNYCRYKFQNAIESIHNLCVRYKQVCF